MVKSHPIDPEEIGLLHKIFEHEIPSHTGRGYMLLGKLPLQLPYKTELILRARCSP